jgi:hypothetical protein
MSFLKTLTFTTANDLAPSLIEKKRYKLIKALNEQLSLLENPSFSKTRKKWVMIDGEKVLTQKNTPIRPWWKETLDGKVILSVRSGLKRLEFEKGKSAIVVANLETLAKIIKGLIDAAMTGELDHLLDGKPKAPATPRQKAA